MSPLREQGGAGYDRTLYIVEARDLNGHLILGNHPQPPASWVRGVTEREIADYYFQHNPGPASASMAEIRAWFAAPPRSWHWRPKTWGEF